MQCAISAIPSCGSICVVIGFCSTPKDERNLFVLLSQFTLASDNSSV